MAMEHLIFAIVSRLLQETLSYQLPNFGFLKSIVPTLTCRPLTFISFLSTDTQKQGQ